MRLMRSFLLPLLFLTLLAAPTAVRADFFWKEYEDWSYFQRQGWWLNCQVMATGPTGLSVGLKAVVDSEMGEADTSFFIYSKALPLSEGQEELRLVLTPSAGAAREVSLTVRRPSLADLPIDPQWPMIEALAGGGELRLETGSGQILERVPLSGAGRAIADWRACLPKNSV